MPWPEAALRVALSLARFVIAGLALWKVVQICAHIVWIFRKGADYRLAVLELIRADKSSLLNMTILRTLDEQYHLPTALVWFFPPRGAGPPQIRKFLNIMGRWIWRQPTLTVLLSGAVMLDSNSTLARYETALILLLILAELLSLLCSRAVLGFVDNLRPDLRFDPSTYYDQAFLEVSVADFVGKFLFAMVVTITTAVVGFGASYYGLHKFTELQAFTGLLPKAPLQPQFVYFSLVTMATVGYGDIQPATIPAQMLVALEIGFGIGLIILLLFALSNTLRLE